MNKQDFITRLAYTKDVGEHYDYVDRLAEGGKVKELRELLSEIQANCQFGPRDWPPRNVSARIVKALALTEGYSSAMAGLDCAVIAKQRDEYSRLDDRKLADQIVAAQAPDIIDQLLGEVDELEMAGLLLHSAVVRQKRLPESSFAQSIAGQLLLERHPLSILPMTLLECERELCLHEYTIGGSGVSIPFGPFYEKHTVKMPVAENALTVTEIQNQARISRICAALAQWLQREVRIFRLVGAIPDLIGPYLPKLGLDCLPAGDDFDCDDKQPLAVVFKILFSAAANGAAHGNGEYVAYGRLKAWQSLAGLLGCPQKATISDIYRTANACQWAIFCANSKWYCQVAWDIGIACLNPVNKELVIVAATDTD